jgi:ubiquinone/menaquinone biosynthesis C-methylase UbiE
MYWTDKQARLALSQFDLNMSSAYPSSQAGLENAANYLEVITQTCNYADACKQIDFTRYLVRGAKVLDLGSGGCWLGAILSKFEEVQTIYALDSSRYLLHKIAPDVLELMQADTRKFEFIEGLFAPILFETSSLDLVVCSSALHHAETLKPVLDEVHRTLKPGGYLLVLNETPRKGLRHLLSVLVASLRIMKDLLLRKYRSVTQSISASSYVYDPILGDRDYPQWYWEKALTASGFEIESIIETGMPTLKLSNGRGLVHFICRAI